jgi:hypothetical protein
MVAIRGIDMDEAATMGYYQIAELQMTADCYSRHQVPIYTWKQCMHNFLVREQSLH